MAGKTAIEWTDATWNPIRGCTRVSEGCRNCYAEGVAARFSDSGMPYHGLATRTTSGPRWTGKVMFASEETLLQPLRWKRPRRIFVNSMSDLFHEGVPDEWIDRIFAVMVLCPQHTFQVLTKRPERMRSWVSADHVSDRVAIEASIIADRAALNGIFKARLQAMQAGARRLDRMEIRWPLPNVWLGVSVEDQATADERIPDLLATPAAIRWVSAEPLLGPIDLRNLRVCDQCANTPAALFAGDPLCPRPVPIHDSDQCPLHWWPSDGCDGCLKHEIDWIVVGGESSPGARPMHPDWARSIRDQCAAAGVPFFFKQWGEWIDWRQLGATAWRNATPQRPSYRGPMIGTFHGGTLVCGDGGPWKTKHELDAIFACVGKKRAGRLLDGVEHNGFPEVRS